MHMKWWGWIWTNGGWVCITEGFKTRQACSEVLGHEADARGLPAKCTALVFWDDNTQKPNWTPHQPAPVEVTGEEEFDAP